MPAITSFITLGGRIPAIVVGLSASVVAHAGLGIALVLVPLGNAPIAPAMEFSLGEPIRVRLSDRWSGGSAVNARVALGATGIPTPAAAVIDVPVQSGDQVFGLDRLAHSHPDAARPEVPVPPVAAPPPTTIDLPALATPQPPTPRGIDRGVTVIDLPQPVYPPRSVRLGQEGTATIAITVRRDSSVGAVKLRRGSGHRLLDEAAREAARHGRFSAAMRDGASIEAVVVVPFVFRLEG